MDSALAAPRRCCRSVILSLPNLARLVGATRYGPANGCGVTPVCGVYRAEAEGGSDVNRIRKAMVVAACVALASSVTACAQSKRGENGGGGGGTLTFGAA